MDLNKRLWIVFGLLLVAVIPFSVTAQTDEPQFLTPGVDVTGTLDAENFIETYVFEGSVGDAVTLDAFTESAEIALLLLVYGPSGSIVAQDSDLSSPFETLIGDFSLPENGRYIVSILLGDGASGSASGDYTLTLTGTLTPPPESIIAAAEPSATEEASAGATAEPQAIPETATLNNGGILIELAWNAAVNLDIEVRDPTGGWVYSDVPISPSGGALSDDVNADCANATEDNPTERVAWSEGDVPAGSYEVIIYYTDGCNVSGPQQFSLNATVDGGDTQEITGTLNPGQQYLAAVAVEVDASWTLFNGGVNAGLDVSLLSNQIAAAIPLPDTIVTGNISRQTPAEAYTFQASAGDVINITMDANSGNLDPLLILLGPNGSQVASNDDREDGNINSTINYQPTQEGAFTVVASRYGQSIGGTEGSFTLSVTRGTAAPVTAPTVASADTVTGADTTTTDGGASTLDTSTNSTTTGGGVLVDGLPSGAVEVALVWNTTADLQLLVRDPGGLSIYDDSPSSSSGGILDQIGNARCAGLAAPVSYIYWPASRLPRGSYEVDVWYQDNCADPNPVTFDLIVNVQGQEIINTSQPTTLESHYVISFEVDQEGNATASDGGFVNMDDVNSTGLDYFSLFPTAIEIEYGDTAPGSISSNQRVQMYSFEGVTGDRIRIAMQRTGGTLDTAIYLISSQGVQLEFNDDITDEQTGERDSNSLIEPLTLPNTGTYYILATRYGLQYGGTTGTYNLTLFEMPGQ
jgi:hypothetical protein